MNLFLVAGEASADMHAAYLLKALKERGTEFEAFGVGGKQCSAQGLDVILPSQTLNVVGVADWMDRAGEIVRAYRHLVKVIRERRPQVAVLLDLPDLNLLLAKHLKAVGCRVVYFISPQIWAWRKYRIRKIRKRVDQMLVLFPFEERFYQELGVSAKFVGHPLLDEIERRTEFRSQAQVKEAPQIAVLPGSRRSEIRFHQAIIRELIAKIKQSYPRAHITIPVASTLDKVWIESLFSDEQVSLTDQKAVEVFHQSDFAVIASGTATLECALVGIPFCLFYRVSASSAWIFRTFARYQGYIGMPNLLMKKAIASEYFQEKATSENLFRECRQFIEDRSAREKQIDAWKECRRHLGSGGAIHRVAGEVEAVMKTVAAEGRLDLAPA